MLPPKLWLNLWPQVGETVTMTTAREQRELTIQLHRGLNWIYCSHLTTVCPQGNSWWKKQGEGFYILDKWVPIQLIPKPFHSAGHLPDPGIKPGSPASWADSLPSKPSGKPLTVFFFFLSFRQLVRQEIDGPQAPFTTVLLITFLWAAKSWASDQIRISFLHV